MPHARRVRKRFGHQDRALSRRPSIGLKQRAELIHIHPCNSDATRGCALLSARLKRRRGKNTISALAFSIEGVICTEGFPPTRLSSSTTVSVSSNVRPHQQEIISHQALCTLHSLSVMSTDFDFRTFKGWFMNASAQYRCNWYKCPETRLKNDIDPIRDWISRISDASAFADIPPKYHGQCVLSQRCDDSSKDQVSCRCRWRNLAGPSSCEGCKCQILQGCCFRLFRYHHRF